MKGILEFTLPEDDENFRIAQDGWKWQSVVRGLDEYLRGKIKHGNLTVMETAILQGARDEIYKALSDKDLTLD